MPIKPLLIEMGIGWKPDGPGKLTNAIPSDYVKEIERLRAMLIEVIDGAWEMEFEDRHTVDSEIIGTIATYLLAISDQPRS